MTTLYNILKGKKTSSILGYAYFYQLLPYFGLFKNLEKNSYFLILKKLQTKGLLTIDRDWIIASDSLQAQSLPKEEWEFLNPLNLGGTGEENWSIFLFALQVTSEKIFHHKEYDPLLDSYLKQQQIKVWLSKNQLHRKDQQQAFYHEIKAVFSQLDSEIANRLSRQFHGYDVNGLVPQQIYQGNYPFNYLCYINDIHAFFGVINKNNLPILKSLFLEFPTSLKKTEDFIKQGMDFYDLTKIRPELKESTLRDHIIELAIRNSRDFPYFRFIQEKAYEVGKKYLQTDYREWRFQAFSDEKIDFLSYRLLQIQVQEEPNVLRS